MKQLCRKHVIEGKVVVISIIHTVGKEKRKERGGTKRTCPSRGNWFVLSLLQMNWTKTNILSCKMYVWMFLVETIIALSPTQFKC